MSRRWKPKPGDRVLLQGVIESVHDGFVMVQVDHTAPHAIPQRYDLVAIWCSALEPDGPVSVHTPLAQQDVGGRNSDD